MERENESMRVAVIREDRELLAELAWLNTGMASLALRIMEGSASPAEQMHYAERLIAAGERLKRRAEAMGRTVIEGRWWSRVLLTSSQLPFPLIRWSLTGDHEQRSGGTAC